MSQPWGAHTNHAQAKSQTEIPTCWKRPRVFNDDFVDTKYDTWQRISVASETATPTARNAGRREKDKDMSTIENINLEQAVLDSIATTSIVRVDASEHDIVAVMTELGTLAIVQDADYSRENDGTWDVYGTTETGEEFRLRVTCNA